ncbi:hypothetical protein OIDMADRAFT_172878 [Oidiodendron maius Zn]|uniref:DUF2828 domain-containing protein n=1 Tax=Oidiodendron maius (strain Zn) TaxID=913774 RepID=A0A0C3C5L0_OIDMZ|nr:hypothetical protein OIDMADRAFT_172878 [Oidiodendron maius Zn]
MPQAGLLESSFPVLVPFHPACTLPQVEFESFLQTALERCCSVSHGAGDNAVTDTFTIISSPTPSALADARQAISKRGVNALSKAATNSRVLSAGHRFMKGLLGLRPKQQPPHWENKMLTENADVAFRSTKEPLVDLFSELEDAVSGPRLQELLDAAWCDDPVATLKIIFNARSIHLGKSSRLTFYRCAGWLAQNHPLTLVRNLPWLSRPIIEKVVKKDDGRDEMVLIDRKTDVDGDEGESMDENENDLARFDVRNGVAHGYWKDLLNILVLSVQGKLDVLANPTDVLNTETKKNHGKQRQQDQMDQEEVKLARHETRDRRHQAAVMAFNQNPVHRALHLTVARLFASQLKADLATLRDDSAALTKKKISLCAKWAPSNKLSHDKHTFIVSSIAEILHPKSEFIDIMSPANHEDEDGDERKLYLLHAREAYRKDVAALRRHLQVVERDLTANTLENIKYERVPSLSMRIYSPIFAEKDTERFEAYINRVAAGQAQISGATLLPSTLIKTVREVARFGSSSRQGSSVHISAKVVDGQWRALVQRIKKSGTLASSIAICDVSGSMCAPVFPDGTCPMDSAIGLSLLLAEVTAPPFGGAFVTFSATPTVQEVILTETLQDKYKRLSTSDWGMNTDFVAVFEKLILPMALANKLKPEEMVKRVFVFSDMQFDAAQSANSRWTTSYERIQKQFRAAGYEIPQLVFWNLAGGRAGYNGTTIGPGIPPAPKPVLADQAGTAIVSGYSQGLLKVFLENGSFGEPEEDEEVIETVEIEDLHGSDNDEVVIEKRKKVKMDPLSTVRRAISHKAYSMLEIFD